MILRPSAFSMYSDMSTRMSALSSSNINSAKRARELGLADAGGAQEHKRGNRAVGVGDAGARALDRVGTFAPPLPGRHALLQLLFDAHESFCASSSSMRETRGCRSTWQPRRNVALGYLFFKYAARRLQLFEALLSFARARAQGSVSRRSGSRPRAKGLPRLGGVGLDAQALELFFDALMSPRPAFRSSSALELAGLFFKLGDLALDYL
jgi:hypothetical protein